MLVVFLSVIPLAQGSERLKDVVVVLRDGTFITTKDNEDLFPSNTDVFPVHDKYVKLKSLNINGMHIFKGSKGYKLDWGQMTTLIYSIELLNQDLRYYKDGKMLITKKNGEKIKVTKGTFLRYIGHDYAT